MFTLMFGTAPRYLIAHTVSCVYNKRFSSDDRDAVKRLAAMVERDHVKFFRFIVGIHMPGSFDLDDLHCVDESARAILRTDEFDAVYEQTRAYEDRVSNEWHDNFQRSLGFIQTAARWRGPEGAFRVYVTHPSLRNGRNLDNVITYGATKEWPNNATVYLWHEVMHSFLSAGNVSHALIELLTDNALRWHLNGQDNRPTIGHESLNDLRAKLLPFWSEYIQSSEQDDIFQFERRMIEWFE